MIRGFWKHRNNVSKACTHSLSTRSLLTSNRSNFLITGRSGSGKTKLLEKKIINLIEEENVSPSKILVLCATQIASQQILSTVRSNTQFLPYDSCSVLTLESFATKIMGLLTEKTCLTYSSYTSQQLFSMMEEQLPESFSALPVTTTIKYFQMLRAMNITGSQVGDKGSELFKYFSTFSSIMDYQNKVITPSSSIPILNKFLEKEEHGGFLEKWVDHDYLFLDDYQFYGPYHLRLLELLVYYRPDMALVIAGDDHQQLGMSFHSIIGEEAITSSLLSMHKYPSTYIHLENQYRCSDEIERLQESLWKYGSFEEFSFSSPTITLHCYQNQVEEISKSIHQHIKEGIKEEDILVLVRTNNEALKLSQQFSSFGLRAFSQGSKLFEKAFIRLSVSYMLLLIEDTTVKGYWDLLCAPSPFAISIRFLQDLVRCHMDTNEKIESILCGEPLASMTNEDRLKVSALLATISKGRQLVASSCPLTDIYDSFQEDLDIQHLFNSDIASSSEYLNHSRFRNIFKKICFEMSLPNAIQELHHVRCNNTDRTVRYEDEDEGGIQVMTIHRARMDSLERSVVYFPHFSSNRYPSYFTSPKLDEIIPPSLRRLQNPMQDEINVLCAGISRARRFVHFSFSPTQSPSPFLPSHLASSCISNYIRASDDRNSIGNAGFDLFQTNPVSFSLPLHTPPHPPHISYDALKTLARCELKYGLQKVYPTKHATKKLEGTKNNSFSHLHILLALCSPSAFNTSFSSGDEMFNSDSLWLQHLTGNVPKESLESQLVSLLEELLILGPKTSNDILKLFSVTTIQFEDGDITIRSQAEDEAKEVSARQSLLNETALMKGKLIDYGMKSSRFQLELYLYLFERVNGRRPKEAKISFYQTGKEISIIPSEKTFQNMDVLVCKTKEVHETGTFKTNPDSYVCKACKFSLTCPSSHHSIPKKK